MLVILTDEQILSPQQVCSGCLLANSQGQPRWRGGQLGCGRRLRSLDRACPEVFECQMGFQVAHLPAS